jgi:SH3-like domain-containing protein
VAVPLAVLVLLVGGLLVARIATDDSFRLGVVVADGVVMREGPDVHARGVDVPEGMEVRVLDDTPGWHKIEIPSGRSGWVAEKVVSAL